MCLNEISKQDKKWREIAFNICRCRSLADDLVQDMYLRVQSYEAVNDWFIIVTIKNLFLNHVKADKKEIHSDDLSYLHDPKNNFEPDDTQKTILSRFNELNWIQKELITESYERSLRDIEKAFPLINYAYAHRQIEKGRKDVLKDKFSKLYKNKRRKK